MIKTAALTPLRKILKRSEERIALNPEQTYREITIRLWGKGVTLRREVEGIELADAVRFIARRQQFIMSRIDARNGAFGLVPEALDGAVVSNDFPVFDIDPESIFPPFLEWMSKTARFVDLCKAASEGTTNRVRLKEDRFLDSEIPLPPLSEQVRIVARVEELAAKIEEAQSLRQQTTAETDRLLITMAHRSDLDQQTKIRAGWTEVAMGDVVREVAEAHTVKPEESYPNLGIYSFGRGLFHKPPIQGLATSANKLYRVQAGQFIYSRLFAFEGSYGWVSDDYDGHFVSGEYPTFDCDPDRIKAQFLYAYFKSPTIWKQVAVGSVGLGDRRQRVKAEQVLAHRLLLPPLEWQNRICEVMKKMNHLKTLQTETAAELDALLPSILDKAFKGEL